MRKRIADMRTLARQLDLRAELRDFDAIPAC